MNHLIHPSARTSLRTVASLVLSWTQPKPNVLAIAVRHRPEIKAAGPGLGVRPWIKRNWNPPSRLPL